MFERAITADSLQQSNRFGIHLLGCSGKKRKKKLYVYGSDIHMEFSNFPLIFWKLCVRANQLCQTISADKWKLKPQLLLHILEYWEPFHVDPFVVKDNCQISVSICRSTTSTSSYNTFKMVLPGSNLRVS